MYLVLHFPWLVVVFSYVFENSLFCSNYRWMLLDTVLLPSPVSTHASYTLRHRSKLRNCLTIYLMLRCTHASTPVPLVPKILELFVAKFIFIQITFMFRFETLSITPRLAFYLLFSISLYLYSSCGSGITPFHESLLSFLLVILVFCRHHWTL